MKDNERERERERGKQLGEEIEDDAELRNSVSYSHISMTFENMMKQVLRSVP